MDHYEPKAEGMRLDRDALKAHLQACVGERKGSSGEEVSPKSIHLTMYNECVLVPDYKGGLHPDMSVGESVFTVPSADYVSSTPFTGLLLWHGDMNIQAYAVTMPCDVDSLGSGMYVTATVAHTDLLNALQTTQTQVSIGIADDIVVVLLNESKSGIELETIRRVEREEDTERDTCLSNLLTIATLTPNVIRFAFPKTLSQIAAWGASGSKDITTTRLRVHRNDHESAAFIVFQRDTGSKTYSYPCATAHGVIVASELDTIEDEDTNEDDDVSFEALVARDAMEDPKPPSSKRQRTIGNAFNRVRENSRLPKACDVHVSSKVLAALFPSQVADKVHSMWMHLMQVGKVGVVILAAPTQQGGLMVSIFNGQSE